MKNEELTIEQLRQEIQPEDVLCFIDTEFNAKEEDIGAVEEIIMLSAVYVNGRGEQLDCYTTLVKPTQSRQLTMTIKRLCQLDMTELEQWPDIMGVLPRLLEIEQQWQPKYHFSWGDQDRRVLLKSAAHCGGEESWQPILAQLYDGQQIYMRYFMGQRYHKRHLLSLEYCARQCKIEFTHQFHAEEDALCLSRLMMATLTGAVAEEEIRQEIAALLDAREQKKALSKQAKQDNRSREVIVAQLRQQQELLEICQLELEQQRPQLARLEVLLQEAMGQIPIAHRQNNKNVVSRLRQKKIKWSQQLRKAKRNNEPEQVALCQQRLQEISAEREKQAQYSQVKVKYSNMEMKVRSREEKLKQLGKSIAENQLALQRLTSPDKGDTMEKTGK